MKWEYRIAALLMALVLLLAARGLWSRYQAEKYVPTLVTWGGEPFFSPCISLPPMVCIWNRNSGLAKRMLKNAASPGGRTPPAARVSFRITCRCQRFRLQHAGRSALCQFQPSFAPQSPPRWQQAESLTVYAIVNTLTEIAGIERVQILIENERSDTLTGHINLTEPLQRDYTILGSILI